MQKSTTVLSRIHAENLKHNYWIVGKESGKILYLLVRAIGPGKILEIGTSVGYSAIWMAKALSENGRGKLWTIESHKARHEKAKENFEAAGLSEWIVPIKGHAPEIFYEDPTIPNEIDFAFFDATKKESRNFFEAVWPRMKKGGVIAVDNSISHFFGEMQKFVSFIKESSEFKSVQVDTKNGLLLILV